VLVNSIKTTSKLVQTIAFVLPGQIAKLEIMRMK